MASRMWKHAASLYHQYNKCLLSLKSSFGVVSGLPVGHPGLPKIGRQNGLKFQFFDGAAIRPGPIPHISGDKQKGLRLLLQGNSICDKLT
jgi:hypothetical protein